VRAEAGNKAQKSHNNKIRLNALLSISPSHCSPPQDFSSILFRRLSIRRKEIKRKFNFFLDGEKDLMVVCVPSSHHTHTVDVHENEFMLDEDSKTRRQKM
jgi:hypothetical protein